MIGLRTFVKTLGLIFLLVCWGGVVTRASCPNSIARVWDEEILSAIRIDTPHPPVQARNLFHLSVAMYDAWTAYDNVAVGYLYRGKHTAADVAAARCEAISYAAYRILRERYAYSRSASNTLAALDARMVALGYDTNNVSLDPSTPAGVGNSVYATVSAYFINDGARQLQAYADYPTNQGGYVSINQPMATGLSGTSVVDVNRWQPLAITNAVDQNGFPAGPIQSFLGAQWLGVRPFALARSVTNVPWIDPGPQPHFHGTGHTQFSNEVVEVIRRSSELTPDDGVTINISPGAWGNNSLGMNDGTGHPFNPATSQPYTNNIVKRGDFARVLAEFWADGPSSETPPGHWNVLANGVADYPGFSKRIAGTGPVLDALEWDVKVYFALNAAVHEAACAAWSLKRYYDGGRPIPTSGTGAKTARRASRPVRRTAPTACHSCRASSNWSPRTPPRPVDATKVCKSDGSSSTLGPVNHPIPRRNTAARNGCIRKIGCLIRRRHLSPRPSPATSPATAPSAGPPQKC